MHLLILAVVVIGAALYVTNRRDKIPKRFIYGAIIVIGAIVFLRVGLPHIAVLFSALIASFPYLRKAATIFFTFLRLRSVLKKTDKTTPKTTAMTQSEAREILGVTEYASRDEIKLSYQRLMKIHHPDKGGSKYFARQLNEAKDLLLRS